MLRRNIKLYRSETIFLRNNKTVNYKIIVL